MSTVRVLDPESKKVLQTLDMNQWQCQGILGGLPINEACGGCVGCILAEAVFYEYEIKEDHD
jgi:hypothetical protein